MTLYSDPSTVSAAATGGAYTDLTPVLPDQCACEEIVTSGTDAGEVSAATQGGFHFEPFQVASAEDASTVSAAAQGGRADPEGVSAGDDSEVTAAASGGAYTDATIEESVAEDDSLVSAAAQGGGHVEEAEWLFAAFGGATWSALTPGAGDGWDYGARVDFEDSVGCGGSNPNTQGGTALLEFEAASQIRFRIHLEGNVETENSTGIHGEPLDFIRLFVNGTERLFRTGLANAGDCVMQLRTADLTIGPLSPGTVDIVIESGTGDPFFHLGAYWLATFEILPLV